MLKTNNSNYEIKFHPIHYLFLGSIIVFYFLYITYLIRFIGVWQTYAISIFLIIAAITIVQQLHFMQNKDLGIDHNQVLTVRVKGEKFNGEADEVLASKKALTHQVEDFLLLDPLMAGCLGNIDRPGDEQLLLREDEDGLEVSLFLHHALLGRLSHDNPITALHSGNLADYCLAIEGVSNFVHLIWNASHDRCVTQLELELLAEIDKFVTTSTLIRQQKEYITSCIRSRSKPNCLHAPAARPTSIHWSLKIWLH